MPPPSATERSRPGITMLGLGAIGSTRAARLLDAGHPVTVWNRSTGRGATLVGSEGMTAAQLAHRATPFLRGMTEALAEYAEVIDTADYAEPGQQSLEFSDLSHIVRASEDQEVSVATLAPIHAMISEQIAAGYGTDGFARIYESLRLQAPAIDGAA